MWKRAFVVVAAALTVAACGPGGAGSRVGTVTPTVVGTTAGVSPSPVVSEIPEPPTPPPSTPSPATPTEAAPQPGPTPGGTNQGGSTRTGTSGSGTTGGATAACGQDHYRNSDGVCVHRPASGPGAPAGATARCKDGTYSYSTHRQGTCSHHGGVAAWL